MSDEPDVVVLAMIAHAQAKHAIGLQTGTVAPWCAHDASTVDATARLVVCSKCRARLDPIDVLAYHARRADAWRRLQDERAKLSREIDALKAEIQRLKAAKRRADKP